MVLPEGVTAAAEIVKLLSGDWMALKRHPAKVEDSVRRQNYSLTISLTSKRGGMNNGETHKRD